MSRKKERREKRAKDEDEKLKLLNVTAESAGERETK